MVSWSVTAMRSRPALTAAATSSAGETMPSEAVVWQCGSASAIRSVLHQRADEGFRLERREVVDPLPYARQLHRRSQLGFDRDRRAAACAAVELREHEPGDGDRGVEALRLLHAGESEHRVEYQQRLVVPAVQRLARDPTHLRELLQQVALRLQPPRGVDEDHVEASPPGLLDAVEDDRRGVRPRAAGKARNPCPL